MATEFSSRYEKARILRYDELEKFVTISLEKLPDKEDFLPTGKSRYQAAASARLAEGKNQAQENYLWFGGLP